MVSLFGLQYALAINVVTAGNDLRNHAALQFLTNSLPVTLDLGVHRVTINEIVIDRSELYRGLNRPAGGHKPKRDTSIRCRRAPSLVMPPSLGRRPNLGRPAPPDDT